MRILLLREDRSAYNCDPFKMLGIDVKKYANLRDNFSHSLKARIPEALVSRIVCIDIRVVEDCNAEYFVRASFLRQMFNPKAFDSLLCHKTQEHGVSEVIRQGSSAHLRYAINPRIP